MKRALMLTLTLSACGDKVIQRAGDNVTINFDLRRPTTPDPINPPSTSGVIFGAYNITIRSDTPSQEIQLSLLRSAGGTVTVVEGEGFDGFEPTDSATATIEVTNGLNPAQVYSKARTLPFPLEDGGNLTVDAFIGAADTWSELFDDPMWGRAGSRAVMIDDSRVIVVGGRSSRPMDALVYDHATGAVRDLGTQFLQLRFPTLVAIGGGRAIVAGGLDDNGMVVGDVWMFNGDTESFTLLTGQVHPHYGGMAAFIESENTVVVFGGFIGGPPRIATADASLIDLSTNAVMPSALTMVQARAFADATALAGVTLPTVLITGGINGEAGSALNTGELLEAIDSTISFTALDSTMRTARVFHAVAPLSRRNGQILIYGGSSDGILVLADPMAEIYNTVGGTGQLGGFTDVAVAADQTLYGARMGAIAVPLPDGNVLISGGAGLESSDARMVIFRPGDNFTPFVEVETTLRAPVERAGGQAVILGDLSVLLFGGNPNQVPTLSSDDTAPVTIAEILVPLCDTPCR